MIENKISCWFIHDSIEYKLFSYQISKKVQKITDLTIPHVIITLTVPKISNPPSIVLVFGSVDK